MGDKKSEVLVNDRSVKISYKKHVQFEGNDKDILSWEHIVPVLRA